jgi:hypothetical protein
MDFKRTRHMKKKRAIESLKEAQNCKIENVADSV